MNPEHAQKLARRFVELPLEKRRLFLDGMRKENMDFSLFPIPSCAGLAERDGLSYAQQRMWFLWQLDPHSAAYNLPMSVCLNGPLELPLLERAFSALVERHESLRTTFGQDGDRAFQRVAPPSPVNIRLIDMSPLPLEQRWASARQAMAEQSAQTFDLQRGPLFTVQVLRLAEQEHLLLLNLHHMITDGWSMNVLIDEWLRGYDALLAGKPLPFEPLAVQYRDYAVWQRSWLEAGEQERQLDYWREHLGTEHPVLELPTDRPYPALPSHDGARLELALAPELLRSLKNLAQRQGVTLFVVLLATFKSLLHRYSGQTDIRVGGLIANRTRSETEGLIGCFINTQVLRSEVTAQTRFVDLLHTVRDASTGAQAHQELPFDAIIDALQPERSQSHNPLFQVMFNHQPVVADLLDKQLSGGLRVANLPAEQQALAQRSHAAASDLMLATSGEGEQLNAAFTYATDIFDQATIVRLADHWRNLLASVCADPLQTIAELSMLSADERTHLLAVDSAAKADVTVPAHRQFEVQVKQTPNAPALILAQEGQSPSLTYAELNERSNRLAWQLREQGVGPDVLVGVALGRSLDMPVALLAVLKAGGAYVPLDLSAPGERMRHVLQGSGLKLLLTHSEQRAKLPELAGIQYLCIDHMSSAQASTHNPDGAINPASLAYVIYTSGSTGRPKGVAISHGALAEFVTLGAHYSDLREGDRVLQFATQSFDGFVEQFYPPLCRGAAVVMRDERLWDSTTFHQAVFEHGVTLADLPAAYWLTLAQDFAASPPTHYGSLRQVHVGGEAMAVEGLRLWHKAGLGHVRLLNTYGPTEATVVSSIHDCSALTPEQVSWRGVPIGKGLAGRRLYVLDDQLNLLPQGALGELYIGGPGLARGYHAQPGLSAERFVADPFVAGERLYRTGDRARLRADGAIEYIGRVDHQVKIRGFRIELGEIESRLQQCTGVREAAVLAVALAGSAQLVAYVVPSVVANSDTEQMALRQSIKGQLQASLPDYMVPTHWLLLAQLPLTPSGKLDRKALPAPDASQLQARYRAPHSEVEICLAAIWQEVLHAQQVGLDDHFFELGGHSLLAAQVIARIKTRLGISLPLRVLFEKPLLGELATEVALLTDNTTDNDWSDMDQFMDSLEEFGA
ncbi:Pyoverdine sidechain peptide synthetase I, epsilon-Lys module [Pseudomonas coronafaciens pv. coronafaciens]|uniref:non-ribosomal peptide synthetase n=1 Tax=Pseudomonas syringae group TaxID=136849 RepID=UPI000F3EEBA5|nr:MULTISPECIES: non-ribosomal peptide synthetase [Pseudomonas syringae group]RMP26234.1 Pyoverdine sidechain peptide synthetase I, epsilon-Lys module [Pseudomonas coronafaciens pv. atropurpurea]RMS10675.1 Pyoverdine sidechain peptide synthetase I, epsilon-Lys module [Pseudomonas coronafaciens pv. coronafaciens]UQB33461.1 amino acid adenylation domain-containing protein [Pseudomonas tremae]